VGQFYGWVLCVSGVYWVLALFFGFSHFYSDSSTRLGVFLHRSTLFNATFQFTFLAQLRDPLPIDVDEVTKKLRIPSSKLTDNGRLLDGVLTLGQGLVGNFGSIFLHDLDHVAEKASKE